MPTRKILIKAIIRAPDDDRPRLAFADWLDTRGESARAEFIRVQCELAHLPRNARRRESLVRRQEELREEHGKTWVKQDGLWYAFEDLENAFERGFVARVTWPQCEEDAFLEEAKHYFSATPLQHLTFGGGTEEVAEYLAKSRFLSRLRTLEFWGDPHGGGGIHDWGARQLGRSRHTGNLQTLKIMDYEVENEGLGDDGVAALAASECLSNLTTLVLCGYEFGDEGLTALAASPHLRKLTALILSSQRIGDAGAQALADSPHLSRLQELELPSHSITEVGEKALRRRFGKRLTIRPLARWKPTLLELEARRRLGGDSANG